MTASTVTLVWRASRDDVSVKRYEVLRDGRVVARPTRPTWTDHHVVAGHRYRYRYTVRGTCGSLIVRCGRGVWNGQISAAGSSRVSG